MSQPVGEAKAAAFQDIDANHFVSQEKQTKLRQQARNR
jgi:hypothetical protein